MSLSDRRQILLSMGAAAFALSGCLRPMLAQDGSAAGLRNRIALPAVDGRFDYFMGKALEDRLGKPGQTAYRLAVQTSVTEQGIAVAQDNSVTRITLLATADWELWRDGDGRPVLSDETQVSSGYSATTSLFATRQIRLDIERRLARELGERISRAIMARSGEFAA